MGYNKEDITEALTELGFNSISIDQFFTKVVSIEEKKKLTKKKEKEEKASHREIDEIHELPEGTTVEEFIEGLVEEYDTDLFDGTEDVSDEGEDITIYFKVGDKFFEVEVHGDSEWIGDWSVRANVISGVSVTSVKEIINFEIIKENKDSITIKLK